MGTSRRVAAALAVGAGIAFAYLVGGTLVLVPGLVIVAWVAGRGAPLVALGGLLSGFGLAWLAMIGVVSYRCGLDRGCVQPNVGAWVAIGAGILVVGVVVLVLAVRLDDDSDGSRS